MDNVNADLDLEAELAINVKLTSGETRMLNAKVYDFKINVTTSSSIF